MRKRCDAAVRGAFRSRDLPNSPRTRPRRRRWPAGGTRRRWPHAYPRGAADPASRLNRVLLESAPPPPPPPPRASGEELPKRCSRALPPPTTRLEDRHGDLVGACDQPADLVVDAAGGVLRVVGRSRERTPHERLRRIASDTRAPSPRPMPNRITMSFAVAVTASRSSAALVVT